MLTVGLGVNLFSISPEWGERSMGNGGWGHPNHISDTRDGDTQTMSPKREMGTLKQCLRAIRPRPTSRQKINCVSPVGRTISVVTDHSCSFIYFLPAGFAGVVLAVFFGFLVFLSFF